MLSGLLHQVLPRSPVPVLSCPPPKSGTMTKANTPRATKDKSIQNQRSLKLLRPPATNPEIERLDCSFPSVPKIFELFFKLKNWAHNNNKNKNVLASGFLCAKKMLRISEPTQWSRWTERCAQQFGAKALPSAHWENGWVNLPIDFLHLEIELNRIRVKISKKINIMTKQLKIWCR